MKRIRYPITIKIVETKMYKSVATNLMVRSVDKSISFYKDVLGFSEVAVVPGDNGQPIFAILVKDGLTLMMQDKDSLTDEYSILGTDKIKPSITIYYTVDDLDSLYNDIKSKHPVYKDPYVTSYGAREFAILDPDGYPLTFAEHQD